MWFSVVDFESSKLSCTVVIWKGGQVQEREGVFNVRYHCVCKTAALSVVGGMFCIVWGGRIGKGRVDGLGTM